MTSNNCLDYALATMNVKCQGVYAFVSLDEIPEGVEPFAVVREFEGKTVIISEDRAIAANLPIVSRYVRLSIDTPQSLETIGLAAMIAQSLAARSIICNILAGFHRDHIFVQVEKAAEAEEILNGLKEQARGWLPN